MTKTCCEIHCYQAVHVVSDAIVSHGFALREGLLGGRAGEVETYPAELYQHGMSVEDLRAAALEPAAALEGKAA